MLSQLISLLNDNETARANNIISLYSAYFGSFVQKQNKISLLIFIF